MNKPPISERLYTVMCDSPKKRGTVLAHIDPDHYGKRTGYWTEDQPAIMAQLTHDEAQHILGRLHYNNPRMVRFEKGLAQIMAQKCSAVRGQPTAHEALHTKAETRAFLEALRAKRAAAPAIF